MTTITTNSSSDCHGNHNVITQAPNLSSRSPGDQQNQQNDHIQSNVENDIIDVDSDVCISLMEYRPIGDILSICQINVEGFSTDKSEFLSKLSADKSTDVLLLQETHKADECQLIRTGVPKNFKLVDGIHHSKYGIATYVKADIVDVSVILKIEENNIAILVVKVKEVTVMNLYKPPNTQWSFPIPVFQHPAVYMGDFNSHHQQWNYTTNNTNGDFIVDWALRNDLHLNFDAKDHQSFQSRIWDGVYNPDLCFVSTDDYGNALPSIRSVYHRFPRSQHRPVFLQVGIQIPTIQSMPIARWNFRKANWQKYRDSIDKNIRWFKPDVKNFKRFSGVILSSAKRAIPRGFRKNYIPTWSPECENLWNEYKTSGDMEIGSQILEKLNEERKERWKLLVENMDFKHSSRKAWDLLHKLSGGNLNIHVASSVKPNSVATRLVQASKMPVSKKMAIRIKRLLKATKKKIRDSPFGQPVTTAEVNQVISALKPGKACGIDGLFPEFFINLGDKARNWLSTFFTNCYDTTSYPMNWKRTLVRAVLKNGKPKNVAESYRPISLLCIAYKILERIIYNRISTLVHEHIPKDQAGFVPNRSCCDQVMALTTHIERGFQDKMKTTIVLVDLSSAFDTVWKNAAMLKLAKIIKCRKTIGLITQMLSNRLFKVSIGGKTSSTRTLNSGLAQGGVLSPLLFILYLSDLPQTISRKFLFADDLALAMQYGYNGLSEKFAIAALNKDLAKLANYYSCWRLRANPAKTESSTFHLSSRDANRTVNIEFCGAPVEYNPTPTYLGVKLNRSMTFNPHLTKLQLKLKTRCNIIQRLTGSAWGSSASSLRTSALALVYSSAEYCCPVWSHSVHAKKVDIALNNCLRLITGTIKSTPVEWLPVLANIIPASIRRNGALAREAKKVYADPNLPIHQDLVGRTDVRLKSRKPFWIKIDEINYQNYDAIDAWKNQWNEVGLVNSEMVIDPTVKLPGFDLPRPIWSQLNRIRTNHGRCNAMLHKWDPGIPADCDCGCESQTIHHIVKDCPTRKYSGEFIDFFNINDDSHRYINDLDINL